MKSFTGLLSKVLGPSDFQLEEPPADAAKILWMEDDGEDRYCHREFPDGKRDWFYISFKYKPMTVVHDGEMIPEEFKSYVSEFRIVDVYY